MSGRENDGPRPSGAGPAETASRLPPGQRRVERWPVLDLGQTPRISPDSWSLTVDGRVGNPVRLDWARFRSLPEAEVTADIHCVTAWSLPGSRWRGVAARTLIDMAAPAPEARFVLFRGYDGYATNVPLARFAAADSLLAHSRNGDPIPPEHGGPVRVVIPALYFWKSAKWVRRITFSEIDEPGYWERRGYHSGADPWAEERYR